MSVSKVGAAPPASAATTPDRAEENKKQPRGLPQSVRNRFAAYRKSPSKETARDLATAVKAWNSWRLQTFGWVQPKERPVRQAPPRKGFVRTRTVHRALRSARRIRTRSATRTRDGPGGDPPPHKAVSRAPTASTVALPVNGRDAA
jgi:hypothetical protein